MNSEEYLMKLLERIQDIWGSVAYVDGTIIVLPDSISVKETQYCVGQLEALITADGFKSLVRGEWTKEELHSGSNFIVSGMKYLEETRLDFRILQRKRWGYEQGNQNSSIILPYGIYPSGKLTTYLRSVNPAVAYQLNATEDEYGIISFTESGYSMDIFL